MARCFYPLACAQRFLLSSSLLSINQVIALSVLTTQIACADESDLLDSSFEELLKTPVISAHARIQQFDHASAAVSVMTAEDIRLYGYRNLEEILNGMRGLHTFDFLGTDFLNSRGYASLLDSDFIIKLDSRLMLLVDGQNIGDIQTGQVLISTNQLLDVNLIERVEYVPGAGSVRYSDTAFLGTINIVTKKGAAWAGATAAVGVGRDGERYQRLQYSGALANQGEILAAYSHLQTDIMPLRGQSAPPGFNDSIASSQPATNQQLFLKMRWPEWQFTLAHSESDKLSRDISNIGASNTLEFRNVTVHTYMGLDYDVSLSSQLKSSTHLFLGQRQASFGLSSTVLIPLQTLTVRSTEENSSMWWGLGQEWAYEVNAQHTLLAGLSWRDDFKNEYTTVASSIAGATTRASGADDRRRFSAYLHDDWQWLPSVKLGLGARFDANNVGNQVWSPRASVQWQASNQTLLKLSQAVTYRDANPFEVRTSNSLAGQQEQLNMTELVMQHQLNEQAQLVASVYRYRIDNLLDRKIKQVEAIGQELEYNQQWESGWRARMSIAHQETTDSQNSKRGYAPSLIAKLNLTAPLRLGDHVFYMGLDGRYVSRYTDIVNQTFGNSFISNLTLNIPTLFKHVNGFVTVRNVFNGQDATGLYSLENQRNVWVQLEYQFK